MDVSSLRARFGIPGTLTFEEHNGLLRLQVTTAAAKATMYLQGAHMTDWQPAGQEPVLFLSRKSEFTPGKPIRGGIPIAFPWFASDSKRDRIDGHPGPGHGFARLEEWTLESAERSGRGFALKLSLGPTEMSRSMGFDDFLLRLEVLLAETLSMQLTVENRSATPLRFEEAFHNYFHVMDVHETSVYGLQPTAYLDKTDNLQLKPASGAPITFSGPVDRVYLNTEAPLAIEDGTQRRKIHIVKSNSRTTVVWNPGKAMPDLGEWDWHEMVCVETVNAAANARTLGQGEAFRMGQRISVEKLKA